MEPCHPSRILAIFLQLRKGSYLLETSTLNSARSNSTSASAVLQPMFAAEPKRLGMQFAAPPRGPQGKTDQTP